MMLIKEGEGGTLALYSILVGKLQVLIIKHYAGYMFFIADVLYQVEEIIYSFLTEILL